MSILMALYQNLDDAKQAVNDLKDNGLESKNIHLAIYDDTEARRGETGGFWSSLSNLFGGGSQERGAGGERQHFMKQLADWGVPEQDTQHYAEAVRRGYPLIVADIPDDQIDRTETILNQYNPVDIQERVAQWQQQGWRGYEENAKPFTREEIQRERSQFAARGTGEEKTFPVIEENLQVGKRAVQRGGVRVYSRVSERPVEENVNLRDESVHVERHPVDRPITDADRDKAFQEQSFEVTETDEEAMVAKQAHVVEEVTVRKDVEERPETIRDTVRRTDVETEDLRGGQMRGTRDFNTFDQDFHNHYDMLYSTRGHDYNYYEPAYHYGYDLAGSDRYRGKKWSEIEPDARRDWERNHPNMAWADFSDAIRHAWERVTSQAPETGPETRAGFTGTTGQEGYGTGTGIDETR